MAKTKVFGKVGVYARELMWKNYLTAVGVIVVGMLIGGAVAATYSVPIGGIVLLVTVGIAGPFFNKGGKARIGIKSEKIALRALKKAPIEAAIGGALLGSGGDIDLIALGPQAVSIEVKTGWGKVHVASNGKISKGGKQIPGWPISQARRGAVTIGHALPGRVWVDAVVCIVNMEGPPLRIEVKNSPVWICSAQDLPSVVSRLPARMHPGAGLDGAAKLMAISNAATSAAPTER